MRQNIFLMPFLVSFLISTLLLAVLILLRGKKKNGDGRIGERHLHKQGISRFGGAAIIASFVISTIIDINLVIEKPLVGVLLAMGLILLFGLLDDLKQLSWKIQLVFQIAIVLLVFAFGVRLQFVSNPFGGIFLLQGEWRAFAAVAISIVWVVFLMNAMNWVDGIDGASGGITLIGGLSIFFLSLRPEVNQPPIGILAMILTGAVLAFLLFNFHPAKIMAGTSGSMFMGFVLAILSIFAGAKMATTLLVLAVPIIDAVWVIWERFRAGDSIFSADKRHLHFRLLELGWSQKSICGLYWLITALVSFIALNTNAMGKLWSFSLVAISILVFLFIIRNKVQNKNVE
ncbi:MAG: MraY family glycosyltransferase [Candidatus Moranbacteria bacterium]|nr:MraY family glycosyltransferase [Candidatus Moranbacteria bacterium]